ncbi:hypothetical protein [Xanthomonas phage RTH11]|nr:hypothetical protein [Xanthomonas phage RTH11]
MNSNFKRYALLAVLLAVVPACHSKSGTVDTHPIQKGINDATVQKALEAENPNMAFVAPAAKQVAMATTPAGLAQATNQQAVPADGTEYQVDLVEMKQALTTKDPGRFVSLPTSFKLGYPVFAATCIFNPGEAECTLADGEVVDEAYLAAHTTVIRNIDVLGLTCGQICVDEEGNVLGHVSKEMMAWRDRNCTWVDYGTPKCK